MKTLLRIVASALIVFQFGCATARLELGQATGGGPADSRAKVRAAAYDVATLPITVPFFTGLVIFYGIDDISRERQSQRRKVERQRLYDNPETILTKRWRPNTARFRRASNTFYDITFPYTDELLRRIHEEVPEFRSSLLVHPACSPQFLAGRFDELIERVIAGDVSVYRNVQNILKNPSTPVEVLERAAEIDDLPHSINRILGYIMEERDKLTENPNLVFERESWENVIRKRTLVFMRSFSDPKIPYTQSLLRDIYEKYDIFRDFLFSHPACSAEFIVEHFPEAYRRNASREKGSYLRMASMLRNPNTPESLIQKAITSSELQDEVVRLAEQISASRS